jgi:aspartate carbamoyltransferase catalytic subunit
MEWPFRHLEFSFYAKPLMIINFYNNSVRVMLTFSSAQKRTAFKNLSIKEQLRSYAS